MKYVKLAIQYLEQNQLEQLELRLGRFGKQMRLGSSGLRDIKELLYHITRNNLYYEWIITQSLEQLGVKEGVLKTEKTWIYKVAIYLLGNGEKISDTIYWFKSLELLPSHDIKMQKNFSLLLSVFDKLLSVQSESNQPIQPGLEQIKSYRQRISINYSMPDVMYESLNPKYSDRAFNQKAKVVVRLPKNKEKQLQVEKELIRKRSKSTSLPVISEDTSTSFKKGKISSLARCFDTNVDIYSLKSFRDGWLDIQDEASQIVCMILDPQPGELVLDACTGSGGKTLVMADLMDNKGQIVAVDKRTKTKNEFLRRCNKQGVEIATYYDLKQFKKLEMVAKFDRVLVDAPCSLSGTIRRRPDLRYTFSLSEIKKIADEQKTILQEYSQYVKPGGLLAYVTCSIFPVENEEVACSFLEQQKMFQPELIKQEHPLWIESLQAITGHQVQLMPHIHGTDGLFLALFTRNI